MKKSIVVLIGICVVAVSVLAWALFVKPEPAPPVPVPSPPPPVNGDTPKIDISDWKTYRNEEFGFEIKYPEDWYIQTTPTFLIETGKSDQLAIISSYDSDNIFEVLDKGMNIDIMMFNNPQELSLKEWAEKGIIKENISREIKEILIDDKPAIIRSIISQAEPYPEFEGTWFHGIGKDVFVNYNGKIYAIEGAIEEKNRKKFEPIFDQMLTTFKFTE